MLKSTLLLITKRSGLFSNPTRALFAKQAKPAKDDKKAGGKQQKKQQAPVVQQPTQKLQPHQKMIHYFTPLQAGLSPSESQAVSSNFSDLTSEDKEILDQLAEKIAALNTSMFYDLVFRRQALGTSEAFIVGSGNFQEKQMNEAIKVLRKDI